MAGTIVVNVKAESLCKTGYRNFAEWKTHSNHVYIGRDMSVYVPGTAKSKWYNPFSLKKYGLETCLMMFEDYIRGSALMKDLHELDGKVLGCWCHPNKCHGDVLIKLRNEQLRQVVTPKPEQPIYSSKPHSKSFRD